MNRRYFLKSSVALTAMLSGGNIIAARKKAARVSPYNHFVFINLVGAPSQFETFDPKPGTSTGGPTKALRTKIPGVQFADNFGTLAEHTDNMAVIRMSAREGNHERAQYVLQTGGYLPVGALKHASIASIAGWGMENKNIVIPSAIGIGRQTRSSGYLGKEFDPYIVDRATDGASNITADKNLRARVSRATALRDLYSANISPVNDVEDFRDEQSLQNKAAKLSDEKVSNVFDVKLESAASRKKYGLAEIGASFLLTRKLIESGVPSIQINYGNWDTHQDNFSRTAALSEGLDQGLSALISDLKESGKYRETLILVGGEFGRTPRINGNDGRDHFAPSWTVLLAGGGIKAQSIGHTSADGTTITGGVSVPTLSFSLYNLLGIDPNHWSETAIGRPIKLSPGKEGMPSLKG